MRVYRTQYTYFTWTKSNLTGFEETAEGNKLIEMRDTITSVIHDMIITDPFVLVSHRYISTLVQVLTCIPTNN